MTPICPQAKRYLAAESQNAARGGKFSSKGHILFCPCDKPLPKLCKKHRCCYTGTYKGRRGACAPPEIDSTGAQGSTFQRKSHVAQRDAQPHRPLLQCAGEEHVPSPKQRCCLPHAFIPVLPLSPVHLGLTCSEPGRAGLAFCLR